jgi:hypothetical protein
MASSTVRVLVVAGALGLVPAVASAVPTYSRSWYGCTSGSVYTCNAISLATTAIMSGSTRVGTAVVIRMNNRQGQLGGGNELWSALNTLRFYVKNRFAAATATSVTTSVPAPATGTGTWGVTVLSQLSGNGTWGVLRAQRSVATSGIGGCTAGSGPVAPTLFTCAAGAEIVLSFDLSDNFNADEVVMFMQSNVANGTTSTQGCYTSAVPSSTFNVCNNLTETTVTPEPVTIALLGTGLFGVAGARMRRRKKHEA